MARNIADLCRAPHYAVVCRRRTVYSTFWKCGSCLIMTVRGPYTACRAVWFSPGTCNYRSGTKHPCRIWSRCCGCTKMPEVVQDISI